MPTEVSFKANKPPVEEPTGALATKETSPLSIRRDLPKGVEGDIDASDLKPPRLAIAQKVGPLSELFEFGTWVYDDAIAIGKNAKDKPFDLTVTVLSFRKQFEEVVPYGDEMGQLFDRVEDVRAAGGQIENKDAAGFFRPVGRLLVAIEKPEGYVDENNVFGLVAPSGKEVALAMLSVRKGGYRTVATPVLNAATGRLRSVGLQTARWKLSGKYDIYEGNSYYTPKIAPDGVNTPDDVAFLVDLLG